MVRSIEHIEQSCLRKAVRVRPEPLSHGVRVDAFHVRTTGRRPVEIDRVADYVFGLSRQSEGLGRWTLLNIARQDVMHGHGSEADRFARAVSGAAFEDEPRTVAGLRSHVAELEPSG